MQREVLKALKEIPFPVGKTLLSAFLRGDDYHPSVQKNHLNNLSNFGALELYQESDVRDLLTEMLLNNYLEQIKTKFMITLHITSKGNELLKTPIKEEKIDKSLKNSKITEGEKEIFKQLDYFLKGHNDEQKKGIISNKEKILCIAGPGTGKTKVLTKRIDFLISHRGINPRKILAITFTRKARDELLTRISYPNVQVQTFNSFCEKYLNAFADMTGEKTLLTFKNRIDLVDISLKKMRLTRNQALNKYYEGKEDHFLYFVDDIFTARDILKAKDTSDNAFLKELLLSINFLMDKFSLRDYSDQLYDTLSLFKTYPYTIPSFEHILVDEYQDVNGVQINLLKILNPKNLFCVGDPRQSIYGWRGSELSHIINFTKNNSGSETINLTKNYRSKESIVSFMNSINLPLAEDLEPQRSGGNKIEVYEFGSEEKEREGIISLLNQITGKVLILSRTNKIIFNLSEKLKESKIEHSFLTDEKKRDIVLGTIHTSKGLEEDTVILMGATPYNFPFRGFDHPFLKSIIPTEYNKADEEKRLFYVAVSRAKEKLIITSSKNLTSYIPMLKAQRMRIS